MKHFLKYTIIQSLILGFIFGSLAAQTSSNFNQRDDTYTLLGLKRAKQSFETARAEYDRQKTLYDKGLINNVELEACLTRQVAHIFPKLAHIVDTGVRRPIDL